MIEAIKSSQNQWVKLAASLKQKKFRDQSGLFLLEGVRLSEELIASDWNYEFFFVSETFGASERERQLLIQLQDLATIYEVPDHLLAKICDTREPQGIAAVARQKQIALSEFSPSKIPLWVLAEGIQDPGNLGTIIRTADAVGCDGVLLVRCVDHYNPKAVRASMGSLFHLPIFNLSAETALDYLQEQQISLYATSVQDAVVHYKIDWRAPSCIALGSEANGISDEFLARSSQTVHIPMAGQAESLNVSISAAVILYEAVRQRRFS